MLASDFHESLRSKLVHRFDIEIQTKSLKYQRGDYELMRVASKDITRTDKVLLVRASIHGEEIAGALSLLAYADEVFSTAHARGIKVIMYPLGNPSGFEHATRYNVDGDKGDAGNGDMMRYALFDGTIVDDLGPTSDRPFKKWWWSCDPSLSVHLPLETEVFQNWLVQDPLDQVVGCLDLHQDFITPDAPAFAYHYSFGDLGVYQTIIDNIRRVVPVLTNTAIGAGFHVRVRDDGQILQEVLNEEKIMTNDQGFIIRHDGSLPDLLYRMGAKYAVTAETMGATPIEKAIQVNKLWLDGFLALVSS